MTGIIKWPKSKRRRSRITGSKRNHYTGDWATLTKKEQDKVIENALYGR